MANSFGHHDKQIDVRLRGKRETNYKARLSSIYASPPERRPKRTVTPAVLNSV